MTYETAIIANAPKPHSTPLGLQRSYAQTTFEGIFLSPRPTDGLILEIGSRLEGICPDDPPSRHTSPIVFCLPRPTPARVFVAIHRSALTRKASKDIVPLKASNSTGSTDPYALSGRKGRGVSSPKQRNYEFRFSSASPGLSSLIRRGKELPSKIISTYTLMVAERI